MDILNLLPDDVKLVCCKPVAEFVALSSDDVLVAIRKAKLELPVSGEALRRKLTTADGTLKIAIGSASKARSVWFHSNLLWRA